MSVVLVARTAASGSASSGGHPETRTFGELLIDLDVGPGCQSVGLGDAQRD
jgi:hypothetical protein